MMKIFASTILILTVLASCNLKDDKTENGNTEKSSIEQEPKNIPKNNLFVIVYDGCEYIIIKEDKDANSSYGFITHKGNSSIPINQCI
jgi:predicted small secreted protein